MKNILFATLFLISITGFSQNNWFDLFKADSFFSNTGNDGSTGNKPWITWETISKFDSLTIIGGERIAFGRGSIWNDTIIILDTIPDETPLKLRAFGNGANPVIDAILYPFPCISCILITDIDIVVMSAMLTKENFYMLTEEDEIMIEQ